MSCMRRCDIWKATDGKFYLLLGNFEHANDDEDCTAYGPFADEEQAFQRACNTGPGNPGGSDTDESGTQPPPLVFERPRRNFFG